MLLNVRQVVKSYGRERVLEGASLACPAETTTSVLGRSGSGKTTLLRIIAGLEQADAGRVLVEGQAIEGVPARERGIVYLTQEALLFPHLDVYENLAFGLRVRRVPESALRARVEEMLARLGLEEHARKRPEQISGGQRQRAAFGRALIVEPRVMLLDEPFGALDPTTRGEMQALYRDVARATRLCALFVTHDVKEALIVGERYAHLARGRARVFETRGAFCADAEVGIAEEIAFWSSLTAREEAS